jgi:hypothetical protein
MECHNNSKTPPLSKTGDKKEKAKDGANTYSDNVSHVDKKNMADVFTEILENLADRKKIDKIIFRDYEEEGFSRPSPGILAFCDIAVSSFASVSGHSDNIVVRVILALLDAIAMLPKNVDGGSLYFFVRHLVTCNTTMSIITFNEFWQECLFSIIFNIFSDLDAESSDGIQITEDEYREMFESKLPSQVGETIDEDENVFAEKDSNDSNSEQDENSLNTVDISSVKVIDASELDIQSTIGARKFYNEFRKFLNNWDKLANARITDSICKLIVNVFAASYLWEHKEALRMVGISTDYLKYASKVSYPRGIYDILDNIGNIFDSILLAVEHGSSDMLFFQSTQFESLQIKCSTMIGYKARYELMDMDGIDFEEAQARISLLLEEINETKRLVKEDSPDTVMLKYFERELKSIDLDLRSKYIDMKQRRPPLSLMLIGPARIGKSTSVDYFAAMVYDIMNEGGWVTTRYDKRFKYFRNTADKFWSGIHNHHKVIIIDDPSQKKVEVDPTNAGGLDEFIALDNTTPFSPNVAELEKKGSVMLRPDLLLITTNFRDGGISKYFERSGGAHRRAIRLEMRVIKSARLANTTEIGDVGDREPSEVWEFCVHRNFVVGNNFHKKYWNNTTMSYGNQPYWFNIKELYSFMEIYVRDHFEAIDSADKKREDFLNSEKCSKCKRRPAFCACMKLQSTFGDIAPLVDPDFPTEEEITCSFCKNIAHECTCAIEDEYSLNNPWAILFMFLLALYFQQYFFLYFAFFSFIFYVHSPVGYFACKCGSNSFVLSILYMFVLSSIFISYIAINVDFYRYLPHIGERMYKFAHRREIVIMKEQMIIFFHAKVPLSQTRLFRTTAKAAVKGETIQSMNKKVMIASTSVFVSVATLASLIYFMSRRGNGEKDKREVQTDAKDDLRDNISVSYTTLDEIRSRQLKKVPDVDPPRHIPWESYVLEQTKFSGAKSTTTLNDLVSTIKRSLMVVQFKYVNKKGEMKISSVHGLGIYGSVILVPRHFIKNVTLPYNFNFFRGNDDINLSVQDIELTAECVDDPDDGVDFVLISHPILGPFKDIRKFIHTEPLTGLYEGIMLKYNQETTNLDMFDLDGINMVKVKYKDQIMNHGYEAYSNKETINGDCGSPYIVKSSNGVAIAGVHMIAHGYLKSFNQYHITCLAIPERYLQHKRAHLPFSESNLDLQSAHHISDPLDEKMHWKSSINHLTGFGEILGIRDANIVKMKSSVVETMMCKDVLKYFDMIEPDYHSPASCNSKDAYTLNAIQMMTKKANIPISYIDKATDILVDHYVSLVEKHNIVIPSGPYDQDTGVNGFDGDHLVNRLPPKTSGGIGHQGEKKKYFHVLPPTEDHRLRYGVNKEIQEEIDYIYSTMLKGEMPTAIFMCHLKDEPLSAKKIAINKVRLFNGCPLALSIVIRQYWMWLAKLLMHKDLRHHFGSAIGANCHSRDWHVFYEYLMKRPQVTAGDFAFFDKGAMSRVILLFSRKIVILLANAGWSNQDIMFALILVARLCYGQIEIEGVIMGLYGVSLSGHPLTTWFNTVINLVYLISAQLAIRDELKMDLSVERFFWQYTHPLTFGDDNVWSTEITWFTHTTVSKKLAEWNIKYTLPDKTDREQAFMNIEDVDFLKRKFVRTHVRGWVRAPVDEKSLIKSLTVCNVSKSISFKEQCASIIAQVNLEYFQYSRKVFTARHIFLNNLCHKYKLLPYIPGGKLKNYKEWLVYYKPSSFGRRARSNKDKEDEPVNKD